MASLANIPDAYDRAAGARLLAGQIQRQQDRLRLAEDAFRAALRLDPSLVQAHRELIYIYGMQLRRPEINQEFLALRKADQAFVRRSVSLDVALEQFLGTGRRRGRADPFRRGRQHDRWSRLALAENLRKMGLHDTAEATLARLPQQDAEANVIRAQIAFDRQDDVNEGTSGSVWSTGTTRQSLECAAVRRSRDGIRGRPFSTSGLPFPPILTITRRFSACKVP